MYTVFTCRTLYYLHVCTERLFPSLDESNWRNDYPDEEEEDESDNSSCTTSSDDGDHSHYRHREPYYGKYHVIL